MSQNSPKFTNLNLFASINFTFIIIKPHTHLKNIAQFITKIINLLKLYFKSKTTKFLQNTSVTHNYVKSNLNHIALELLMCHTFYHHLFNLFNYVFS